MKKLVLILVVFFMMFIFTLHSGFAVDVFIKSDKLTYGDYEISKQTILDYWQYEQGRPTYLPREYLKRDQLAVLNRTKVVPFFQTEKLLLDLAIDAMYLYRLADSYDNKRVVAVLKKSGKIKAVFDTAPFSGDATEFGLFDLLGNNSKQLIVRQNGGGSGGFCSAWIFNLEPDFRTVYKDWDQGFKVDDLNSDGAYEIIQRRYSAVNIYSISGYESVYAPIILKYDGKQKKYVCANNEFQDYLLKDTNKKIEKVREMNKKMVSKDNTVNKRRYVIAFVNILSDYVYAGKKDAAWAFFNREYRLDDKKQVKQELRKDMKDFSLDGIGYSESMLYK